MASCCIIENVGTPDVFQISDSDLDLQTRCKLLDVIDKYQLDKPSGQHRPGIIAVIEIAGMKDNEWYLVPGEWWSLANPGVLTTRQRNGKYLPQIALTKECKNSVMTLLSKLEPGKTPPKRAGEGEY